MLDEGVATLDEGVAMLDEGVATTIILQSIFYCTCAILKHTLYICKFVTLHLHC